MDLLESIRSVSQGATFLRADLHIHSFGGSYDVKDDQMTPQNIIDLAIKEELQVISITDHNEICNVEVALKYSENKKILVIPGLEVSTPDGHLLLYLPDIDKLRKFYGQLNISSDKKMCNQTIAQCLDLVGNFDGFGIAAHIGLDSGFEMYMKGYTPFKHSTFNHPNLFGLEICSPTFESWFTDRDDNSDRKAMLKARRTALNEDSTYDLAKVMSSDAHALSALGKNAAGNKKLTRLKMDKLNFHSFKIALIDHSARVRIEELIPPTVPRFIGLRFDGGFLDGQVIHFSSNLNCIIGGRGAGKSTVLESLRACSGNPARDSLVDNEVWPDRISLIYEDETGRQITLVKDKLKDVFNSTDPISGIEQVLIESFGQGETAETIQHCGKDPGILIKFLDGFVDFQDLKEQDISLCNELLENQSAIERLTFDVETVPQIEKAKKNADDQLTILKSKHATEVVELEEGLARERGLRDQLIMHLKNLIGNVNSSLSDKKVFDLVLNFEETKIKIGKDEFKEVKQIIKDYSKDIDDLSKSISVSSESIRAKINQQLKQWKEKEKESQDKIELIRKEIEAKGGKLDLTFIRKVTKDATDFGIKLAGLQAKKIELSKLKESRKALITKRKAIKKEIFKKRYSFIYKVNQNLKNTVIDFNINIEVLEGKFLPDVGVIIKDAMGYRTSQVPKADAIINRLSYSELMNCIESNTSDLLQGIKVDGVSLFPKADADIVVSNLTTPVHLHQIERCEYEDLPVIKITRRIFDEKGAEKFLTREFSKLSLGQQQSILLSILLFSNRNCPLLIDQPEDNLDSEFIYKTLVKNLRRIKEYRQVIIVTHNANIAVLGDAELIVPLKSTSERTIVVERGSIDNNSTKTISCSILEGGEKAFQKRKEMYGF